MSDDLDKDQTAAQIKEAGYLYMGVTDSPDGEYTSSVDILEPLLPPEGNSQPC